MSIISLENKLPAVILFLHVNPKDQSYIIDEMIKNSKKLIVKKNGFISENIHKSYDGTYVVNYAQWETRKSCDNAIFLYSKNCLNNENIIDSDCNTYELSFSGGKSPTRILKNANLVTVINKFTVDPKNQRNLLQLLDDLRVVVEKLPGFISANVHRSFDGKRVVSYAQWDTKENYESVYTNPAAKTFLDKIKKISKFSWNFFEIDYTTD